MDALANFATSLVAVAPSPATTGASVTVATGDGAKFPAAPFNVTIWPFLQTASAANAEIARCTAVVGDVLTIVRGQEGSIHRSVVVGDQIAQTVTAGLLSSLINSPAITGNPTVNGIGFGFNKEYYVDSYLHAAGLAWTPTTDVGPYVRAACADAHAAGGGTVRLGAGVGGFTGKIQNDVGVNIEGYGSCGQVGVGTVLQALDNTATVWFGSGDQTGANSGGGISSGFMVDGGPSHLGDSTAQIYSNLSVGRTFESIWSMRSAGVGWLVEQSQNCLWLGCEALFSGTHGLVVDHGAAGNKFERFEVSSCGGSALRYQESYWDAGAPWVQPFNNTFDHCIFERDTATTVDHIFINSAGNGTIFRDSVTQNSLATSAYGIHIEPGIQPGTGSTLMPVVVVFADHSFSGSHKAILARNNPGVFFEGLTNNTTPMLITIDGGGTAGPPGAHGAVHGPINSALTTIWAFINSGNSGSFQNFYQVPIWTFLDTSFASYAYRTSLRTDAGYRLQIEPTGPIDWNDGTSGTAMAKARLSDAKNAVHINALSLALNGSTAGASGPPIYQGSAAPVAGAHVLGELVINNAPTAAGPLGWICYIAGTPGTWQPIGITGPLVFSSSNAGPLTIPNELLVADATPNNMAVVAPAPALNATFEILRTDQTTNTVTVSRSGSTIDGATLLSVPPGSYFRMVCYDGTNWRTMAKVVPRWKIATNSANFTAVPGTIHEITTGASTITVTLPTNVPSAEMVFKKMDSGTGTFVVTGTVDETVNPTISKQWGSLWIVGDGTSWVRPDRHSLGGLVDVVANGGLIPSSFILTRTPVADVAYTILATDRLVAYTSLTLARSATLPAPGSYPINTPLTLKDEAGTAGAHTLTLVGTVDGAVNPTITTNYGSIKVYTNGTAWFTLP